MFRFTVFLVVVVVGSDVALGDIVSWNASSGVLPNDPSIPPESRFTVVNQSSFLALQSGFMNVNDNGNLPSVLLKKDDIDSIGADSPWAYQIELRMNSHSRPDFEWGAELGIGDAERWGIIVIASDAVGFEGALGDSFINDASHEMDTTDSFHTYRVVKDSTQVSLFVDTFETPVLSIPYADLFPNVNSVVRLAATSSRGEANYDVRSFAYNPNATLIPEPSTLVLAAIGLLSLIGYRRRRRGN